MNRLYGSEFNDTEFIVYDDRPDLDLIEVKQEHTNTVLIYQGKELTDSVADGIFSSKESLKAQALAIKTADCLPVAFIARDSLALVHAGWKGLQTKILTAPELQQESWEKIIIGPSIFDYEVQPDFKSNFPDSPHFYAKEGKLFFDLQKEAASQLASYTADIEIVDMCTLKNKSYNSYRRDQTKKRNWNLLKTK